MDVSHSLIVGHEMMLLDDIRGERLCQRFLEKLEHIGSEFCDSGRIESAPLHLL